MVSDEQCVQRALAGDESAFATLVDRYQERLLRFLKTRAATRADAEDAFQDAFVAAWRYLHTFDPRWRFSTWLYRIALRELKRRASHPAASVAPDELAGGEDPLAGCAAADERDNLWRIARQALAPDAVSALWLSYVEELPQREVATALGRSLPWVKVTLFRARRTLHASLAERGFGNEGEAYG